MIDDIIFVVQCIGAVSFSVSGALAAIGKKADVIGVLFLSLTTVFGGGLIRDIILGVTPPHLFWDKDYYVLALISVAVSLLCFHLAFIRRTAASLEHHEHNFLLNLTDAIGLSVFCVCGVQTAMSYGYEDNAVLLIFAGVTTGVGGGILRDVMSGQIPLVFHKHVYLLPALIGSAVFVLTCRPLPELAAMLVSVALIIVVRILAIVYKWNLPTPQDFAARERRRDKRRGGDA